MFFSCKHVCSVYHDSCIQKAGNKTTVQQKGQGMLYLIWYCVPFDGTVLEATIFDLVFSICIRFNFNHK